LPRIDSKEKRRSAAATPLNAPAARRRRRTPGPSVLRGRPRLGPADKSPRSLATSREGRPFPAAIPCGHTWPVYLDALGRQPLARHTLWSVRISRRPARGGSQTGRGSASRFGRHGGRPGGSMLPATWLTCSTRRCTNEQTQILLRPPTPDLATRWLPSDFPVQTKRVHGTRSPSA
jgi:hypothetical protein